MMNSKVPYFYVIQHIGTNRYYAGSKYGADADPNQLLNASHSSPYVTSSLIVKSDHFLKYGVESPMQRDEIKEKVRASRIAKHGPDAWKHSKETLDKIKSKTDDRVNRPIIHEIRWYLKTFKVKLGKGWIHKSDAWCQDRLSELKSKYGQSGGLTS